MRLIGEESVDKGASESVKPMLYWAYNSAGILEKFERVARVPE